MKLSMGWGQWLLPRFAKQRLRQITLSESELAQLKNYGFLVVKMRTEQAPVRDQNLFCGEYPCHCVGHSHDETTGMTAVSIKFGGV